MPCSKCRANSANSCWAIEASVPGVRASISPPVELFFELQTAIGTNAMAKAHVGMVGHVALHLMPVVLVVADFFAITTDGQQSVQLLDVRQSAFQFAHPLGQRALQADQTRANLDAGAQLGGVEWLRDIIVGAALKSLDDIFFGGARS